MLGTVELRGVRVLSAEISPLAVSVLSVGNGKSKVGPSWSVTTCGMTPPPSPWVLGKCFVALGRPGVSPSAITACAHNKDDACVKPTRFPVCTIRRRTVYISGCCEGKLEKFDERSCFVF